jgi:hypothetical protein
MDRHCVESAPWGSLRWSVATAVISQYLGRVITEKNGEIATPACAYPHADRLPVVPRNEVRSGMIS